MDERQALFDEVVDLQKVGRDQDVRHTLHLQWLHLFGNNQWSKSVKQQRLKILWNFLNISFTSSFFTQAISQENLMVVQRRKVRMKRMLF